MVKQLSLQLFSAQQPLSVRCGKMYNVSNMNTVIGGRFVTPDAISTHFHLKEGDVISDFGAGSGFFIKTFSEKVGPEGKVYACEIQKQLVERLGEHARVQGLHNIHPLWCDLEEANGIKIPDGELDVAILINTLFVIEDKETAVKEMGRTLRRGGNFFVVDWTESFSGMGPVPENVIVADEAINLFESNGFIFERDYPAGEHHYGLAFKKI